MLRFALLALAASPAIGQEAIPLRDLLDATHVHGIAGGTGGLDSVTLASHHGLFCGCRPLCKWFLSCLVE